MPGSLDVDRASGMVYTLPRPFGANKVSARKLAYRNTTGHPTAHRLFLVGHPCITGTAESWTTRMHCMLQITIYTKR